MKRPNLKSLFIFSILLFASFTFATAQNLQDRPKDDKMRPMELFRLLGLSQEQMQQIRRINQEKQPAMREAQSMAQREGQTQIEPEHLLTALVEQSEGVVPEVLRKMSVDLTWVNPDDPDAWKAAARDDFRYSPAMKKSGVVWKTWLRIVWNANSCATDAAATVGD